MTARQRVVGALAGKQRPDAANACSIESGAVLVLTVSVAVVAIPARSLGKFYREQCINGAKCVDNSWIIGRAKAEAHKSKRVRTDDVISTLAVLSGRLVFDRHEALGWRSRTVGIRWSDPHVVAGNSELFCEVPAIGVNPALNVVVPGVGCVSHRLGLNRVTGEVGDFRTCQQCGDLGGECERRVAGIFFPAILLCDGTIANDEGDGFPDHGPPAVKLSESLGCFAAY